MHDWHAEVLAIRAFNRFLVDECADLARGGFGEVKCDAWVRWRRQRQDNHVYDFDALRGAQVDQERHFELQDDVSVHMYCSEAPCGDASMELTMAEQADDTAWTSQLPTRVDGTGSTAMLGRGYFDQLGIVRRKPARPDAPVTLSKSCSDKLAMKQCTGLLSATATKLIWPANVYLSTLVLPEARYVPKAVERAFGRAGRMKGVTENGAALDNWRRRGYDFKPFEVETTMREFQYSRRTGDQIAAIPSNISALATPLQQEILINGVLQGRKQFDPKGASCVSRRSMWRDVVDVLSVAEQTALKEEEAGGTTYGDMKMSRQLEGREKVKRQIRELHLRGWQRNFGDEDWMLQDTLIHKP